MNGEAEDPCADGLARLGRLRDAVAAAPSVAARAEALSAWCWDAAATSGAAVAVSDAPASVEAILAQIRALPGGAGAVAAVRRALRGSAGARAAERKAVAEERQAVAEDDDDRPVVVIGPDLHRVNDDALAALARDPGVWAYRGALCEIAVDADTGRPVPRPLDADALCDRLSRCARWARRAGRKLLPTAPPLACARQVLTRAELPGIRVLAGVAIEPALRADGSILQGEARWDEPSGWLYAPAATYPEVPDAPTAEQVREAVAALLEVIADAPMAADDGRSAWLAGLLTPFARPLFDGPAPLFLVEATTRGSGKTLLAQAAALIAQGRISGASNPPDDDDEIRKVLLGAVLRDARVVLLDNCVGELGWPSLDAALTSSVIEGRVLGGNTIAERKLLTALWATANNPTYKEDLVRRVLPMRLVPNCARPEDRPETEFRHPDLLAWVAAERPRLAVAALTILRAHARAGYKLDAPLAPWGSYAAWSRVVRGALVAAGQVDPIGARAGISAQDKGAMNEIRLMAAAVDVWGEGQPWTAAMAVEFAGLDGSTGGAGASDRARMLREVLIELAGDQASRVTSRGLGRRLARLRDVRADGFVFRAAVDRQGVTRFRVEKA